MRILAVDDEPLGLQVLTDAIKKAAPADAEIVSFRSPKDALKYVQDGNDVYLAFLDIQMPVMSGTELAKHLKLVSPTIHIIFTTGYDSYMGDAFALHVNGYVMKPITKAKIKKELDSLALLSEAYHRKGKNEKKKLRCQCFGNFEIFAGDDIIHFRYDKTKEVIAYMISRRGALCSNGEIVINVWDDDDNHDSYLRGIRKDIVDTLHDLSLDEFLVTQRGKMGINSSMISCDYYDFLEGDAAAINSYHGEFMSQYSWGEFTNAELEESRFNLKNN